MPEASPRSPDPLQPEPMSSTDRSGRIVTFYSYKGGTGRSMALANIAWILASNGHRVLAIDWDLEAPGLHRYFRPFLLDQGVHSSPGLIDMLINYAIEVMTPVEEGVALANDWYVPLTDISRYTTSLKWEFFPGEGTVDLMPAGQQDESYPSRVTSFDWEDFYNRLGGWGFLEALKARLRKSYDYILIDSRTGVSDTSGICTVQMPDALAVCFTYNIQSIEGAAAIAISVQEQRQKLGLSVRIFPVPMRVEQQETDRLAEVQPIARRAFSATLEAQGLFGADYWKIIEVPYFTWYAYMEVLAPFHDEPGRPSSLLAALERVSGVLTDNRVTALQPTSEYRRKELYALGEETRGQLQPAETLLSERPELKEAYVELIERQRRWEWTHDEEPLLSEKELKDLISRAELLSVLMRDRGFEYFLVYSREKLRERFNRQGRLSRLFFLLTMMVAGILVSGLHQLELFCQFPPPVQPQPSSTLQWLEDLCVVDSLWTWNIMPYLATVTFGILGAGVHDFLEFSRRIYKTHTVHLPLNYIDGMNWERIYVFLNILLVGIVSGILVEVILEVPTFLAKTSAAFVGAYALNALFPQFLTKLSSWSNLHVDNPRGRD